MALRDIQEMIQAKEYHIPLTELIPVFDGSEELDETLTAMEHVRQVVYKRAQESM